MDAVHRMRQMARKFGYLQDCQQYRVMVSGPGIIEMMPVDPAFYFLPVYDPLIVFGRPRAGLSVGITFGPRIAIGARFAPWGWGKSSFGWACHSLVRDSHPWARTQANHATYSHPYQEGPRQQSGPRVESHAVRPTHPATQKGREEKEKR